MERIYLDDNDGASSHPLYLRPPYWPNPAIVVSREDEQRRTIVGTIGQGMQRSCVVVNILLSIGEW